ncbi:MAG: cysteine-rich CWC family protein [Betaproteobacteria bacterium]
MTSPTAERICPRCDESNACGYRDAAPCWCSMESAPSLPAIAGQNCYCQRCLRAILEDKRASRVTPRIGREKPRLQH